MPSEYDSRLIFKDNVLGLWPKYDPSAMEVNRWVNGFRKYNERDIVDAINEYYDNCRANTPRLSGVLAVLHASATKNCAYGPKDPLPIETTVFIQCVDNGNYIGIYLLGDFGPDDYVRAAQRTKLRCEEAYKKPWNIVVDTTEFEMFTQKKAVVNKELVLTGSMTNQDPF